MKIKLTLEYRGEAFSGWQIQEGLLTVQGELERAISVYLQSLAKRFNVQIEPKIHITGSGRTDAGVHARGQVASFFWPKNLPYDPRRFLEALNGITVRELVVQSTEEVDDSFDARFTPHLKCYSYSLLLRSTSEGFYGGNVWRVGENLNIPQMIKASQYFVGQHDFSSFRARDCTAKSTVRDIPISEFSRSSNEMLVYTVCGRGFLKQMIRIMLGTLVEVGFGRLEAEDIPNILLAGKRSAAGPTAPPQGLVLEWVRYCKFSQML